jgi:Omp85 superfamily domain
MRLPAHLAAVLAMALRSGAVAAQAQEEVTTHKASSPALGPCDGLTITAVSIDPERPPFTGHAGTWRKVARAVGLHHATTRADVVRAYLLFKSGDACVPARLSESERLLRDLPFIANAHISTSGDSTAGGGVVVEVRTTDEIPVLVEASLRQGAPNALALGNDNVGGYGVRLLVGGARRKPYRDEARFEFADVATFGSSIVTEASLEHNSLGDETALDVSRPFLSSLQWNAWHVSVLRGHEFPIVLHPAGDNEAIDIREWRWSVSALLRSQIGHTTTLAGPVALGASARPAGRTIFVTDSGPVESSEPWLSTRVEALDESWVGGMFALRRVNYVTRTGVTTLFGTVDVPTGWQAGTLVAPGLGSVHDVLWGTSAYVGAALSRVVVLSDIEAELRQGASGREGPSSVASLHVAAFVSPTARLTLTIRDDFAHLSNAWLPTQLSLGDPVGGPRGYGGSRLAGGARNLARADVRWATPSAIRHADVGVALFVDAAHLWAGDVPFGATASRQSVGVSLLAAYPTGSSRIFRVDLAIPIERTGSRGIEIRFNSGDPSLTITREPNDVTQARVAPVPSSLFGWASLR